MPQPNRLRTWGALAVLGLALSACPPAAPSAPVAAPPTAAATLTPTVAPNADALPTPATAATPNTAEPAAAMDTTVDWTTVATVDGDYYVLGNPAAPIRLIDYGDFL